MAGSYEPLAREVTIVNKEGFHSRPVMKFVELAQKFASDIEVVSLKKQDETVDGKSAMELMLLGATKGTIIRISATGPDAQDAVTALVTLVNKRFRTKS